MINLLRRMQPNRDWALDVHTNSVEAILKGARVLRAIVETSQGPTKLNQRAIGTDDVRVHLVLLHCACSDLSIC